MADVGMQMELVVEDTSGETLLHVPVERGSTVSLEYTHSVEKTEVRDVYEVRQTGLVMTYMEFSSFGAGLPAQADVEWTDNGTLIYRVPENEPNTIIVATGEIAGHELVVDGTRYDLVELADGGSVTLQVEDRFRI